MERYVPDGLYRGNNLSPGFLETFYNEIQDQMAFILERLDTLQAENKQIKARHSQGTRSNQAGRIQVLFL